MDGERKMHHKYNRIIKRVLSAITVFLLETLMLISIDIFFGPLFQDMSNDRNDRTHKGKSKYQGIHPALKVVYNVHFLECNVTEFKKS